MSSHSVASKVVLRCKIKEKIEQIEIAMKTRSKNDTVFK